MNLDPSKRKRVVCYNLNVSKLHSFHSLGSSVEAKAKEVLDFPVLVRVRMQTVDETTVDSKE